MRTWSAEDLVIGAFTAIALLVVAVLWSQDFFSTRRKGPPDPVTRHVAHWQLYAQEGERIGPAGDSVTLIEFSDFQCPFCRTLKFRVDSLRRMYPGKLTVIFRYFPLDEIHPYARAAALAAACASAQGHFASYHDLLFRKQDSIGLIGWTALASEAEVPDTEAFGLCVRDSAAMQRVQVDLTAGQQLGLTGTPGLLVDGTFMQGAPSLHRLDHLVRSALDTAR